MIISNDDEDNDNHGNYDSVYDAKGEGFDSSHSADSQQNTHTNPTRGKLPNMEAKDDGTEMRMRTRTMTTTTAPEERHTKITTI